MAEITVDRMGRSNYDKSGVEITVDTPRQAITFDGRWATWPRTEDGTRILFSCLTAAEKQVYYAYRRKGNSGSGNSSNSNNVSQLKKFSDLWAELSPLLKEDQVRTVFEKTWAAFPGLRLPLTVLSAVYTDKNFELASVLGVTALSLEQVQKF